MTDGPRVSVRLGLTLPIPGVDYGMVKPEISIEGLDPAGDVEGQIRSALETGAQALARIDEHMELAIAEMIAPETGKPGYRERLATQEATTAKIVARLNEVIRRLKATSSVELVAEAVAEAAAAEPLPVVLGHPPDDVVAAYTDAPGPAVTDAS